jgi:histidine triad (HIT) family protein
MPHPTCPFCLDNQLARGTIRYEDDLWYYLEFDDLEIKNGGMIITKRHVATPFEINEAEWQALRKLLPTFKALVDRHHPDGYNMGWNIGSVGGQNVEHAHLHLIPRYKDEPLATKGIRHAIKQPTNRRPHGN